MKRCAMAMAVLLLAVGLAPTAGAQNAGGGPPEFKAELSRKAAADAGSPEAPVLFCIGIHVEPQGARVSTLAGRGGAEMGVPPAPPLARGTLPPPNYNDKPYFQHTVQDLLILARMVERRGGKLSIQVQTPFTRVAAESKEPVLADLEKRGHEIALHFHEDAHLGRNCERLPAATWTAVMKEEIDYIKKAGAQKVRYWSGGNLFGGILGAASASGLDVFGDHKNPRVQQSDPRLMTVTPWRPADGPTAENLDAFARHDPKGHVVYLPVGAYTTADYASLKRSRGPEADARYFDFMTEGLERSLRAARKDRVNVFHVTVHPGEFRGGPREPYGIIEQWLTEVVDPLVKAGKVRWATFAEAADAHAAWEKANPGVDPREGESAPPAAPAASAVSAKTGPGAPATFLAIHCEPGGGRFPPGQWQAEYWPALVRLVETADRYGAKLTLMFNPQWAEYVCADPSRFDAVKAWQKAGHEVALHYHTIRHGSWCGYTNRAEWKADPRYRGSVADMMGLLAKLAAPDKIVTGCCGIDVASIPYPRDASAASIVDETDFPDELLYDVDGIRDGLAAPLAFTFNGKPRLHFRHHFMDPREPQTLEAIKAEFARAGPGQVLGVVTHEIDFAYGPGQVEEWLTFLRENGAAVRTVRDITARMESEKTKAATPAPAQGASSPRGYITFVVNVHDTRHVGESADTVRRAIGVFTKYGVRGEFYFTAPMAEAYAAERPDIVKLLKDTRQTISYHMRPPHPVYAGFESPLRGLDEAALATALKDYETFRLDPATGGLDRSKPGGYSCVAQVFGGKPVSIGAPTGDPRIRRAAVGVYRNLGARMIVQYHERGTRPDRPYEWVEGLLARPSDFSITRWALPGEREESFWWNRLDSPQAADYNPAARLKSELAAWKGPRPPFVTALIHENDFARAGPASWTAIYYGPGEAHPPREPPFPLDAPDRSRPRPDEARERLWRAYEELVAFAAANLRVVTSEDIVAMAAQAAKN